MGIKKITLFLALSIILTGCGGSKSTITEPSAYDASAEAPADDGSYLSIINGMGIDIEGHYILRPDIVGSYSFCGYQREVEFVDETDEILVLSGYITTDYFTSMEPHNVNYIKDEGYVDRAVLADGEEVYIKPIYPLTEKEILAAGLTGRFTIYNETQIGEYIVKNVSGYEYIDLNSENVTSVELLPENYMDDFCYTGDTIFTLSDGTKLIGSIYFVYIPFQNKNSDYYNNLLSQGITWVSLGHSTGKKVDVNYVE